VLFRLDRGRLVPVELPAALAANVLPAAAREPGPHTAVLTVNAAGDPVVVAESGLADRLVYAVYDAARGGSAWRTQVGPAHSEAEDVGDTDEVGLPLVLHWTGTAWVKEPVDVSFDGFITDIADGVGGAGWAIAEDTTGRFHLLRFSAGVWRDTAYPEQDRTGLELTSVTAAPDGTAWAVGGEQTVINSSGVPAGPPLILQWTAGAWHQVAGPGQDWLPMAVSASKAGVWVAAQTPGPGSIPSAMHIALARRTASGWQTTSASEPKPWHRARVT